MFKFLSSKYFLNFFFQKCEAIKIALQATFQLNGI